MPRDERTFITVHDGLPDHPKIEALSDAAFRLLVSTWCWCSKNKTDGLVVSTSWRKRGTARSRAELLAVGLAVETEGGVRMHDYLKHQRSAAEIDELTEKRRAAGSKGGKAKASATASASPVAKQTASKSVAESETDTEELLRSSQHAGASEPRSTSDPRFVAFWDAYPRRVAKPDAFKAFAKAVGRASPDVITAAAIRLRDDPNREDAYTAHPATWLNRDGWDDPPLPPRLRPASGAAANGDRPIDPATGRPRARTDF